MKNFTFYTHQTVSEVDGVRLEHWLIEKKYNGINKFAKVRYLVRDGQVISGEAHICTGTEQENVYKLDSNKSLVKVMRLVKKLQ